MSGTANIRKLGTLMKLGAIAICQGIAKDGFQPADLLAPLNSPSFLGAVQPVVDGYKEIIIEASELGYMDVFGLAQAAWAGWEDVQTELSLATAKVKEMKGV